jgi:hypothetical protein
MATDTVANHAWLLNTRIPAIAKSLGVSSVHLVAHSKGGLDVREYLALYQPNHDKEFKVLSYTTLSTPHNGSALADLLVQRDAAVESLAEREFVGFPSFTETILNQTATDIGTTNLTTAFTASLNASTVSAISPAIVFNTVAGDADLNGNGEIDRSPDEYREMRDESAALRALDATALGGTKTRLAMNVMYGILRTTESVSLRIERRSGLRGITTVAVVAANPTVAPLGNDLLVSIPSGQGEGSVATRVANTHVFSGSDGRNHSSVANGGVAATVARWLFDIELKSGGLQ